MPSNRTLLAMTTIATVLSIVAFTKTSAVTDNSNYVTRAEIPALIKETLAKNPEMVIEALKKLREQQAKEGQKDTKAAFEKYKDEIYNDNSSPFIGSKNADVTIVEFFDYHCGYCKRMLPVMTQLVQEDKNVKVVFREFPILSEDSKTAARAAIAFNRINKEKYLEYHSALMNMSGRFDEKALVETAEKFGVKSADLIKEMKSKEVDAVLAKNRQIANDFGIRGTPAMLIGEELLPGAMSLDDLKKIVADTRAEQKK